MSTVLAMTFGFAVGDFVTVGELAWVSFLLGLILELGLMRNMKKLYRDCYQIARGAPEEFQLLLKETNTLASSLKILQEEIEDPKSTLVKGGEARVRTVNGMVDSIRTTLNKLEKLARKYEILGLDAASKRRQIWSKFKWSVDFFSIDGLRSKASLKSKFICSLLI